MFVLELPFVSVYNKKKHITYDYLLSIIEKKGLLMYKLTKRLAALLLGACVCAPQLTGDVSAAMTTQTFASQQEEDANSFRYHNGKPVYSAESKLRGAAYGKAWTKVDGKYRNSAGQVISTATKRGIDVSHLQGKSTGRPYRKMM